MSVSESPFSIRDDKYFCRYQTCVPNQYCRDNSIISDMGMFLLVGKESSSVMIIRDYSEMDLMMFLPGKHSDVTVRLRHN